MLTIENGVTIDGNLNTLTVPSKHSQIINAQGLTCIPALIDPHVHFRVPGAEHKETWITGAQAAIAGGVTTVFDMPNNVPSIMTAERLKNKQAQIQSQLRQAGIPLRHYLYFGADKNHVSEIPKIKSQAIGIKIFMGCSTGDLLVDDDAALEQIFKTAAENQLLVSVHAEDEATIHANRKKFSLADPGVHSLIRDRQAAVIAVKKAIALAEKYRVRLCILHLSTQEELELVKRAKDKHLPVYAEVAPHHLFFNQSAYRQWGNLVQMNPPLRDQGDQEALWQGVQDGTVDFLGTDHAPHTLTEKQLPYGKAPSGVPGVELLLPLMATACVEGRLSFKRLIELTKTNIERIFQLPANSDLVWIDLKTKHTVNDHELRTKVKWSPYAGMQLTGWPVYTLCQDALFQTKDLQCLTQ